MQNRLVIIGAGGHGKVIADIALQLGYEQIAFLDDRNLKEHIGFPVLGMSNDIEELDDGKTEFVIAIGDNHIRKIVAGTHQVPWATLVHPNSTLATSVKIGEGTVVMAGAITNADAVIGKHCIINTGAIVEHDNIIEDYAHISPRVALGGNVHIGSLAHLGIGATVKNNISICSECVIGAGTVVVKDIRESGTYIGVSAKRLANTN